MNLLTNYDKEPRKIFSEPVNSGKINSFQNNYWKLKKVIDISEHSEISSNFDKLTYFRAIVLSTLRDYKDIFEEKFVGEDWSKLTELFEQVIDLDPGYTSLVEELFEFVKLIKSGKIENLLFIKLLEELKAIASASNIVIVNNYRENIQFECSHDISLLTPYQMMKSEIIYDYIFFIGSPNKYKSFNSIFLGNKIKYLYFDFFNGDMKITGTFSKSLKTISNINETIEIKKIEKHITNKEYEQAEDIPKANLSLWVNRYESAINKTDENMLGRVLQFENNKHMVFPLNSKIRTVYIEKDSSYLKMKSKSLNHLFEGDWIIIKRFTENQFYMKRSKELFGEERYEKNLDLIKRYKESLMRRKRDFDTYSNFRKELKKNNIEVKSDTVLRTWTVMDVVKPGALKDLLKYLNYSDEVTMKTIKAANFINKAHAKVGRELSNHLKKIISNIDFEEILETMERDHFYIFNIEGVGEFVLETVRYVHHEAIEVQPKDLYKILDTI